MRLIVKKSLFLLTFIGIFFYSTIRFFDRTDSHVLVSKNDTECAKVFSNNKFNKLDFFVETDTDSNFCVDEFEFEYDSSKQILFGNFVLDSVLAKKSTIFSCRFSSIKNKIPLYKLFCKWKVYTDLLLV